MVLDKKITCEMKRHGWRWHITGVEHCDGKMYTVWWDTSIVDGVNRWMRGPGDGYAFQSDAARELIHGGASK